MSPDPFCWPDLSWVNEGPRWPITTPSTSTRPYPCDMGTGQPLGYHHFQASPSGIVVCMKCGKKPTP